MYCAAMKRVSARLDQITDEESMEILLNLAK
jgi:hypothetical protein